MIKNQLKINDSKTKFIIFQSPLLKQNLSDLSVSVRDMQLSPSSNSIFFKSGKSECNNSGYKLTGLTWWP